MAGNSSTKGCLTQEGRKRSLENAEGPAAKTKNSWGILISQGSWADRSPLHEAASQGRLLGLKTLLLQGYSPNILTIDHVTPLHEACMGDHIACARVLIEAGANVNATTIDGMTPLFHACSRGSAACVELLLENGAKPFLDQCFPSPIHEACRKGHSGCLEALVTWGADVDQDIPYLGTPLYVASASQQLQCIRKLLYAGADIEKGRYCDTALHAAAQQTNADIIKLLLDFGANANAKNTESKRPVEMAIQGTMVERILLIHEATPPSLCQQCRLCIRRCVGRSRLHLIPLFELPEILKKFLQYR